MCNFIQSPTNYHIVVTNESEAVLQTLGDFTQSNSNKCNQLSAFFLCFYLFRNCELHNTSDPSSGLQLSICQSKCPSLFKVGAECFEESNFQTSTVLEKSNNNTAVQEIVATALKFNCHDPTTYAVPGVPISNTACDNVSFIDDLLQSTSATELDILGYL